MRQSAEGRRTPGQAFTKACVAGLLAAATLWLAACGGGEPDRELAAVERVSAEPLAGTVGKALSQMLVLRLNNKDGDPLSGISLRLSTDSGYLFFGTVISDGQGLVRDIWTLGTRAGPQELRIASLRSDGRVVQWPVLIAEARPEAPARWQVMSGSGQSGTQLAVLAEPFSFRVMDRYGNPVPGVVVAFSSPEGGSAPSVTTNASGWALTPWTLGLPMGRQTLVAHADGLPPTEVAFATVTRGQAGAPARLERVDALGTISANQHALLPQSLRVRVVDSRGIGVPAATVSFSSDRPVSEFEPTTPLTDADGYAEWVGYVHGVGAVTVRATIAAPTPQSLDFPLQIAAAGGPFDGRWDVEMSDDRLRGPRYILLTLSMQEGAWICLTRPIHNSEHAISPYTCGSLDAATGTGSFFYWYAWVGPHGARFDGSMGTDAAGRAIVSGTAKLSYVQDAIPWSARRRGASPTPCTRTPEPNGLYNSAPC